MKLNLQQMDNVEVLTRSQLKNVLGGSQMAATGTCFCTCSDGSNATFPADSQGECDDKCDAFCSVLG